MVSIPRAARRGGPLSTISLEAAFNRGIIRDAHYPSIPPGALWDCVNFLLVRPGALQRRGGWRLSTSTSTWRSLIYGFVDGDSSMTAVASNPLGRIVRLPVAGGASTDTALDAPGTEQPKYLQNAVSFISGTTHYAVFPSRRGTGAPWMYSASTGKVDLTTAPVFRYVVAYKDRLWAAGVLSQPQRLYASALGDATSWDTNLDWIDFDQPITGLATVPNAILVFSESFSWRLTGSTPGVAPDLDRQPLGPVGCTDARAISVLGSAVVVANPEGVWVTSGGSWERNLVQAGGISDYWRSLFSNYTGPNPTSNHSSSDQHLSVGIYRDYLFVSFVQGNLLDTTNPLTENVTLCCYIPTASWFRLATFRACPYFLIRGRTQKLFATLGQPPHVGDVGAIFSPGSSNRFEGSGESFTSSFQTRPVSAAAQLEHFRNAWLLYDLQDSGGGSPTFVVEAAPGLTPETFSTLPESPLGTVMSETRRRLTLAKVAKGMSFRISTSGPSTKAEVYGLQVEARPLEHVREQQ